MLTALLDFEDSWHVEKYRVQGSGVRVLDGGTLRLERVRGVRERDCGARAQLCACVFQLCACVFVFENNLDDQ